MPIKNKQVLIIQDDKCWHGILGRILRNYGYSVTAVFDRHDALYEIDKYDFGLIILDPTLDSQVGAIVSGEIILFEIEKKYPSCPVFILSGYDKFEELKDKFGNYKFIAAFIKKTEFCPKDFEIFLKYHETLCLSNLVNYFDKIIKAKTNKEKKNSLENFAEILFETLPGFKCYQKNIKTSTGEIDLIFSIDHKASKLFKDWGQYIAIECKNWTEKIDTQVVSHFAQKLRNAKIKVGIILAKSGITGDSSKDAMGQIRNIFQQENISIITFDLSDLEKIVQNIINLDDSLEERYQEIRFLA
jgi:CheY-like chemotaxis protein/Holliday junction resolvase-like predicted endonuclease